MGVPGVRLVARRVRAHLLALALTVLLPTRSFCRPLSQRTVWPLGITISCLTHNTEYLPCARELVRSAMAHVLCHPAPTLRLPRLSAGRRFEGFFGGRTARPRAEQPGHQSIWRTANRASRQFWAWLTRSGYQPQLHYMRGGKTKGAKSAAALG